MKRAGTWGLLLLITVLPGCGDGFERPENTVDLNSPAATMLERQDDQGRTKPEPGSALFGNAQRCRDEPVPVDAIPAERASSASLPLSPGDLVHVAMPGDEPPAGNYKVDSDGTISFANAGKLPVSGLAVEQVEAALARKLVASGLYRAGHAHPTIRLLDRDQVRVMVAGAVFSPGQVTINERPQVPDTTRQTAAGDHAIGRTLSVALSHAAGVRPDADIAHIVVEHMGRRQLVDFTGFLDGSPVNDVALVDGDRVSVPSRHCFQAKMARPTPITPPGVRVGGAKVTNAHRGAVLVSVNPETGESEVIERDVEALIRRADRDLYNPVIMPNDAIACYDSSVTNVREVLRSLGDLATSAAVVRLLAPR